MLRSGSGCVPKRSSTSRVDTARARRARDAHAALVLRTFEPAFLLLRLRRLACRLVCATDSASYRTDLPRVGDGLLTSLRDRAAFASDEELGRFHVVMFLNGVSQHRGASDTVARAIGLLHPGGSVLIVEPVRVQRPRR